MTRERALELAKPIDYGWTGEDLLAEQVADIILAAVAEAYESCAKIAEGVHGGGCCCGEEAAEEIRAGAPKPRSL